MATTGSPITVSTAGLLTLGENGQMSLPAAGKVGIGDATPDHLLDVAGNIGLDASGYINWGDTDGTSGYGFRDNAGTMEYKNSAGSWTSLSGGVATNFAAGTVSAPGLYVTGDTNTGFYQATADTLSATAGGVEAARFNTAASGVNYLTVTPSATTAAVQLATAGTDSNINLAIMPKGTGNVGIGTTAPSYPLQVVSSGGGVSGYFGGNPGGTGSGKFNRLTLDNTYGAGNLKNGLVFASQGASKWSIESDINGSGAQTLSVYDAVAVSTRMVFDSSGNVGIGTASPGSTLHVYAPSTNTASNFYGIRLTGAQSTANTGIYYGGHFNPTYTAASGNTLADLYGLASVPQNTGTGTITSMQGLLGAPQNTSTGAVVSMYGAQGVPQNTSGGTVTTMYGVLGLPIKSGTGAVTTMYGVYSRCDNTNATGVVTNCYGLFLETPTTTGAITNKYGVYQQDSNSTNYFGGNVGIGTATPGYALDVWAAAADQARFRSTGAHSGEGDQPFRLKVITDSGDRDHADHGRQSPA